jgi:NAD(P)H dehydrogenase (quinone)
MAGWRRSKLRQADEDLPSVGNIDTAERFGRRIAMITRRLKNGIPFETERITEAKFRQENIRRKEALTARNH